MSFTADKQKVTANPGTYPRIRNRQDMETCLYGAEVVEAFGFDQPSRRRALERMLSASRQGKKLLLVDGTACSGRKRSGLAQLAQEREALVVLLEQAPSGWRTDGALICLEGMTQRRAERLLKQLYEADSVVLGVLTEKALESEEESCGKSSLERLYDLQTR